MQKVPCVFTASKTSLSWLWALLPLLLAAGLVAPVLGRHVFDVDEAATMIGAGARHLGPYTLAEAVHTSVSRWPGQAWGHVVVFSQWGRVVGWSELAIRTLPWLTGLLTLAWVFRIGRSLFTARVTLTAILLLSTSIFFLTYMHKARSYGLAMLFAALILWCYGRIILQPRPPGRGTQAGLLLGSIGLLYSHYLASLFLVALVLFHLLFVPKTRRWWRPMVLYGLAFLVAGIQIPGLLGGLSYLSREELGSRILTAPALISHFLRYITNGLVNPSPPFSELLLLALPLLLVIVTILRLRGVIGVSPLWLLAWTALAVFALMTAINTLIQFILDNRIRYLMPLWPMTALLVGAGLWRLADRHRILATGMLTLWLIYGTWLTVATEYRYGLGYFSARTFTTSSLSFANSFLPLISCSSTTRRPCQFGMVW